MLLALGWAQSACGDSGPSSAVIEYCTPIEVGARQPPVAAVVVEPERNRPLPAAAPRFLLATEQPITTIDASTYVASGGDAPSRPVELVQADVAVVDALSIAPKDSVVGRALFSNFDCLVTALPPMGPGSEAVHYDGFLAGDVLRRYVLRLAYEADKECRLPWTDRLFPTVTFLVELGDTDAELAGDGYAVFDFTLGGGGTFLLNKETHDFGATRVGVSVCLEPAPFSVFRPDPSQVSSPDDLEAAIPVTGVDAFLLVATGTVPLVLSRSVFDRLEAVTEEAFPLSSASYTTSVGTEDASRTFLVRLAVVGDTSDGLPPCAELAKRRRIAWIMANKPEEEWSEGTWRLDAVGPAVAEFDGTRTAGTAASLETFVLPDTSAAFQGLRFEALESLPQVDGLLGHEFLHRFEFFLDYPKTRLALRCNTYEAPLDGACDPDRAQQTGRSCCNPNENCICPATAPCCQWVATTSR